MILRIESLRVEIGGRLVCDDLSLEVDAGSRWAILGVNGVGKTTLLSTLAGYREPQRGRVLLDAAPLTQLAPRQRARRMGVMSQEDSFHLSDPDATALEIALLGRLPHLDWWRAESAHDIELARAALAAAGLEGIEARPVARLSGGERRRLALAALLAQEVALCLLDEPTSHLDMHQQIALLDLLVGWDGRTLLMTLHDVNLATRYCSHVLLLFGDGEWCAGPAATLLSAEVLSRLYRHPVEAVAAGGRTLYFPA